MGVLGGGGGREGALFLDTIGYVLDNRRKAEKINKKEWKKLTGCLQLVSLQVCRVWRETTCNHLRVAEATPRWLWKGNADPPVAISAGNKKVHAPFTDEDTPALNSARTISATSRIPTMRFTRVTWERSAKALRTNSKAAVLSGAKTLALGRLFNERLGGVLWKDDCKIERMVFGKYFNQSICSISWPPALREIKFGYWFDQDLNKVKWPSALRKLTFGDRFNTSFTSWPVSLETVSFGEAFNQDLSSVKFPRSLKTLLLEWSFNSTLAGVVLPETLEHLEFRGVFDAPLPVLPSGLRTLNLSASFNRPIEPASLPKGLKELVFGFHFNQPIDATNWPSHLERIVFGFAFDQPVDRVVWPQGLQKLTFGHTFNQSLIDVHWPGGLQEVHFGLKFNQPLRAVELPKGLVSLTITGNHPGQLDGAISWPPSLASMSLEGEFNQPVDSIHWPPTLTTLSFGWRFNQALDRADWPQNMRTLAFGGNFDQPVGLVVLPESLEHLAFYQNSGQAIDGLVLPKNVKTLTVGNGCLLDAGSLPLGVKVRQYEYFSMISCILY